MSYISWWDFQMVTLKEIKKVFLKGNFKGHLVGNLAGGTKGNWR